MTINCVQRVSSYILRSTKNQNVVKMSLFVKHYPFLVVESSNEIFVSDQVDKPEIENILLNKWVLKHCYYGQLLWKLADHFQSNWS